MAKNIDFMGATFPDVPSIRLPQHEGGLVSFTDVTDTTAVASDVANGKYFYTADGTKTIGTASGGITPSGTIQITQNGQVDVTQYAIADVNVSGGGGGLEIVKAISYDKLLVQDEGITIPSYTTTATNLVSSTTGDAIALDRDNYVYSVASVGLVYPIYNNFADTSGKFEFSIFAAGSEYVFIPANTIASQSGKKYTSSIASLLNDDIRQYFVYHSSASALNQTTTATGVYANPANPASNNSAGTITLKTPGIYMKGSTTSYKQAAWGATADIRCQYQICLFKQRIDASEKTRFTLDGLLLHAINCYNSQSHTLTEIYS